MLAHGFVDRPTKDVDLFTEVDDQEALRVVVALREALEGQGLITRDTDRPPVDHRFVVVIPNVGPECTVEVFADGGRLPGASSSLSPPTKERKALATALAG